MVRAGALSSDAPRAEQGVERATDRTVSLRGTGAHDVGGSGKHARAQLERLAYLWLTLGALIQLTSAEARRIWLHAQRLDTTEPFGSGPKATPAAVAHLGYLQIGT